MERSAPSGSSEVGGDDTPDADFLCCGEDVLLLFDYSSGRSTDENVDALEMGLEFLEVVRKVSYADFHARSPHGLDARLLEGTGSDKGSDTLVVMVHA